jgi:cysteinyl-tRNA synthetase
MLKDGKMSKSSGTSYTVRGLIERGYDPMAFRYLLLTGHYRQPMDFAFESLDAAAAGYKNIVRKIADLMSQNDGTPVNQDLYNEWHDKILTPISDNLKTSETLVVVQDLLKNQDVNAATKLALLDFIDDLLGLQLRDRAQKLHDAESETAPDEIQKLAAERMAAKKERDFARADELRAKIDSMGWTVTDTPGGFKLVKKL